MTPQDLTTAAGLAAALAEVGGSWAELSRLTGVPVTTLKSRGKRLGVQPSTSTALAELQPRDTAAVETRPGRQVAFEEKVRDLAGVVADARRQKIDAVLRGEINELDAGEFMLALEIDTPTMFHDHFRLLRAAKIALDYHDRYPEASQRKYIQKVANALQVDAKSLDAYVLVLQNEIRYRRRTGQSPLETLPTLTMTETPATTGGRDGGRS